jgi:hypothetical protein
MKNLNKLINKEKTFSGAITKKAFLLMAILTFSTNAFSYMRAATTISLECHTQNEGTIIEGNISKSTCEGYDDGHCGPIMKVKNGKAINLHTPNGLMNLEMVDGPDNKWYTGITHGAVQFVIQNRNSFNANDQFWAILNLDTCQVIKAAENINLKENIFCTMVISNNDDNYYQHNFGPSSAFTGKYTSSKCVTAE